MEGFLRGSTRIWGCVALVYRARVAGFEVRRKAVRASVGYRDEGRMSPEGDAGGVGGVGSRVGCLAVRGIPWMGLLGLPHAEAADHEEGHHKKPPGYGALLLLY